MDEPIDLHATDSNASSVGSISTIKNTGLTIASNNYRAIFQDNDLYDEAVKLMICYLPKHPLNGPFNAVYDVDPLSVLFKCVFPAFIAKENP